MLIRTISFPTAIAQDRRDVADHWYAGEFETTYQDVLAGCCEIFICH